MKTAILFIVMMLVLIAPHEFGHFIVAKLCDVKVNEFAVGMGPLLFKKKKGETQYSFRAIPIGGFCAMEGENDASENPRAFNNKNPGQRIAILLAGVTMNVVIAFVACIIAVQISGVPVNTLDSVVKDSPAAIAGIQGEDKIIRINGNDTNSWEDVTSQIDSYKKGDTLNVVVDRNGSIYNFDITPKYDKDRQGYTIGIVASVSKNPIHAMKYGAETTVTLTKEMLNAFKMLFVGGISKDDVSGPVGLVKIVGEASSAGAATYLILLALVSLNLAVINLIPIPGLDGGKLLFVILKFITRGKISDEMETKASIIGLLILLSLFVLITINDVKNLF